MNYYPHHIGDFDKATRHLTRIERSIYRDLLDLYYDTEKPLPLDLDVICRKVIARTNDESTAVEQVLNEFFYKTDEGWHQERCDHEIDKFHANTSQKSEAGKASAQKRAEKKQRLLNARSTPVEFPFNGNSTNQEPVTSNHKPEPIGETPPAAAKRASRKCPVDFEVTEAMQTWAKTKCPSVALVEATEKFKDHTFSRAMVDWPGAWRNWIRGDQEKLAKSGAMPAWRQEQRERTQQAVPTIAAGTQQNPTDFFKNIGNTHVPPALLG